MCVRLESTRVKQSSGASLFGRLLALLTSIILGRKAFHGQTLKLITNIIKLRPYKGLKHWVQDDTYSCLTQNS
jgi:hypothetical protein